MARLRRPVCARPTSEGQVCTRFLEQICSVGWSLPHFYSTCKLYPSATSLQIFSGFSHSALGRSRLFSLQILWLPLELWVWAILILKKREKPVRQGKKQNKTKTPERKKNQQPTQQKKANLFCKPRSARAGHARCHGLRLRHLLKRWAKSQTVPGEVRRPPAPSSSPALPVCQRRPGRGEGASSLTGRACLGVRLCLVLWLLFLPPKSN